jgi:transposase
MSNYAFFVGIDWADRKHDVAIVSDQGKVESLSVVEHSADSIDALVSDLLSRAQGRPIAIILEQSKGALINALVLRENVFLFPINPKQLAAYRESFQTTKAKNDKRDAQLLARLLFERHRSLHPWKPDDEQTRMLNRLCQSRRHWVEERTSVGQQLLGLVKCYFPALLCLTDSRLYNCGLLLKLLSKWPDPRELKRQHPNALKAIFEEFGYKNAEQRDELIKSIKDAPLYTKDLTLLQCAAIDAQHMAKQLSVLEATIELLEEKIQEIMAVHPDAKLFSSLRGAGNALAPRLLTAFGTDREKFQKAEEVACYSGVAPVTKQSGKSCTVNRRHACNKYLLQTFHEFAGQASIWCPWSKAFYNMCKAKGMKRNAILRKLAFKWIRILFRCWKSRTDYDQQRYIDSLLLKCPDIKNFLPQFQQTT